MARPIVRATVLASALAALAGCDPRVDYTEVPLAIALSSTDLNPVTVLGGAAVETQVVIVAATPGQANGLTATIQYAGQSGWLAATLDRTSVAPDQPATLAVTATPGSLPLGTYAATIRIDAPDAANAPITIAVRFVIDPRPATRVGLVTQPGGPVVNGQVLPQQPVVQLFNDQNQPAPFANVIVTASIVAGGGQLVGAATASTDANGRATFAGLGLLGTAGAKTLRFSAPGLTSVDAAPVTVLPGAAAQMVALSAVSQTANAGTAVAAPPRVRIVDQSGNGVAGFTVAFAATAGSVILPGANVVSAADGSASLTSWTLNPVAGANSVTASATGLAGSPITFTATGQVGPATQFTKVSGDNLIGLVSTQLGTPHVVKVADAFGNGVAGTNVTWSVSGGGSVNPTTSVTDQNGLAQTTRTLGPTPGAVTTTASATVGGPVQLVFSITAALAGPAQIVKTAGDAQSGTVGAVLPTPIQVQVLDALNTPQAGVTVTFTTANPGGVLTGGTPVAGGVTVTTNGAGMASATWRLGTVSGAQSVQAAVGGPAPAVFTATATPGPVSAAISTVAASPTTITAGGSSTITVTARDANGNAIPGQNVTLGVVGAAGLTPVGGTTNGAGQFAATLAATVAGAKVVSATVAGVPVTQTATVTVTAAAPATMLAVSNQTLAGLRFGQAVAGPPSVQVFDQFGNAVPGATVTFGVTSGVSSVSPLITTTNAAGIATVTSWIIGAFAYLPAGSESVLRHQVVAAVGGLPSLTFTGTVTVSLASDLRTWFNQTSGGGGCTGGACHSATAPILNGTGPQIWTSLRGAGTGFRYVIPGDSTSSSSTTNLLWLRPTQAAHGGGIRYTSRLLDIVKAWIAQGGLDN